MNIKAAKNRFTSLNLFQVVFELIALFLISVTTAKWQCQYRQLRYISHNHLFHNVNDKLIVMWKVTSIKHKRLNNVYIDVYIILSIHWCMYMWCIYKLGDDFFGILTQSWSNLRYRYNSFMKSLLKNNAVYFFIQICLCM